MTITDRLCQSLATYFGDRGLGSLTTVQPALTETTNAANDSRIIIRSTACNQRAAHLRGVFDVSGEVIVRQSIDEVSAKTSFNTLCQRVKEILLDEKAIEGALPAIDGHLKIYNNSFHLGDQAEMAGERGFQAIFSWRAVAADTPST